MNSDGKEIELQTYSLSYGSSTSPPSQLPYNWDGDCHLVMNPAFYDSGPLSAEVAKDDIMDFMDVDITPAKMDESMKATYEEAMDVQSNAPTETSTADSLQSSAPIPSALSRIETNSDSAPTTEPRQTQTQMETQDASTAGNEAAGPRPSAGVVLGVEEQLDFIIESTKKHPKARTTESKHVKARKNPEQLAVLTSTLSHLPNATREQIRSVAKQTGLKEVQVYKWYWDQKRKTA